MATGSSCLRSGAWSPRLNTAGKI